MSEFIEILDARDQPTFVRASEVVAIKEMQNSFKGNGGFSTILFLKSGLELRSKTGMHPLMQRLSGNDEKDTE